VSATTPTTMAIPGAPDVICVPVTTLPTTFSYIPVSPVVTEENRLLCEDMGAARDSVHNHVLLSEAVTKSSHNKLSPLAHKEGRCVGEKIPSVTTGYPLTTSTPLSEPSTNHCPGNTLPASPTLIGTHVLDNPISTVTPYVYVLQLLPLLSHLLHRMWTRKLSRWGSV
jgi:hypothetical protein